jgi:hypothetical protein
MRFFNWLYTFAANLESIVFVLAALGAILGLAWGKNGLKKLNKKREALLWKWVGILVLSKLGLMAFTLLGQLVYYFKR